uniref:NodB homology domain-containing protein n=1 Tax=viral metagenome TaxID=1070528 RepID=A0A6M3XEG5_9ZZZZ
MGKKIKYLAITYDDFNCFGKFNCLNYIYKFKDLYPNIKITLFTIPNYFGIPLYLNNICCSEIINLIKNNTIEICIHGYKHNGAEFKDKSIQQSETMITASENILNQSNIKFKKIFKAPHHQINTNACIALDNKKYLALFTDKFQYKISEGYAFKNIMHNWDTKDNADTIIDILISYGHVHDSCNNYIATTFDKICKYIDEYNPIFKFASEII